MADTKIVGGGGGSTCRDSAKHDKHECDCHVDGRTLGGKGTKKHPFGIVAPVQNIVYRPGNPGGSVDNVYATWAGAYAAIESVRDRGRITLEIDSRYVDPVPAKIPPGVWNFAGVSITAPTTFANANAPQLEFEDGCSIVMSGPEPFSNEEWLQLRGNFLRIIFNGHFPGPGPNEGGTGITPLLGVNLIFLGGITFMGNTDPYAAPMMKSVGFLGTVVMEGGIENSIGLFVFPGTPAVSPAPVWDLNGGNPGLVCAAGNIFDNAITDSVGGGSFGVALQGDGALGGATGVEFAEDGVAPTYSWPGLDLAKGSFVDLKSFHRDRILFRSSANVPGFGPPPINITQSPYDAAYNECLVCNTDDYAGDGDRFLKIDATTMEIQDDTFPFGQGSVGQFVTIAGSTTLANNGIFQITFVSPSGFRVQYANAAGVAEDFFGTWTFPGGNIVVNAPRAYPANGERVIIKNYAGPNNVILTAAPSVGSPFIPGSGFYPGDNIEGAVTGTVAPGETKTWADDGRTTWLHIASA